MVYDQILPLNPFMLRQAHHERIQFQQERMPGHQQLSRSIRSITTDCFILARRVTEGHSGSVPVEAMLAQ